ncbi:hypothetical protein C8A01DRAFT_16423 [Parachaetomium inaequale]|uniref:RING-type domain-containing protein n=1 Tax=Parachaetomium inaequale TaxID=2588326 RepID=A0AAN6PEU7_9PEZI|nr:hypothetical protein C8A01DRAFT_16423 [Parachaetomium inaequale]
MYDLLIVTDATSSMGGFLDSLNSSLQDIIRISATTACFSRIGVLGYRDYDQSMSDVTEWSGWHSRDAHAETSQEALLSFAKTLRPQAGGDWPEAARTGLALAYQLMRPEAKTIVLLYADAPPHTERRGGLWQKEQDELRKPDAYGGNGELFADWTSVADTLSSGEKQAQVFSILDPGRYHADESNSMFTYLSTRTGGVSIAVPTLPSPATISKVTIGLLMAWMGAVKQGAKLDTEEIATHVHYIDTSDVGQITSEQDKNAVRYLPVSAAADARIALRTNLARSPLSLETLAQVVPRREHPVMDFAKRYKADAEYRGIVVEQLAEIIESDVSAIALNPVFGALWRTVCNDRLNPARDRLITRFGLQVDKTENAEKKDRLKKWLEESYDWAGEIVERIKAVPEESRYPCVFLDPTVRFAPAANAEDDAEDAMTFTRDELLEIGRSCDHRILRRLGRILTRLTYVSSKEELPAHVRDVAEDEVPKIPMALAKPEHERKFWKVLLHTVLPGTMLAARPAALLAALSVRMGIKPLEEAAYTELMAWRDNWNTLDIPETWNTNCLSLLLEADEKHQQSVVGPAADSQTILKEEDRKLFEALVNYKLLEMNLDTTLTAEIGWTPTKSKAPLGPVVTCKSCQFPRSVTVMADDGVCGPCAVAYQCESKEAHQALVEGGVSKTDSDTTLATWTECSMTHCRAQYVLYNPGNLRVRPKCHYCRQSGTTPKADPNYVALTTAPCVTCTQCTNRIIWPTAYRPPSLDPSTYKCPACTSGTQPTTTTTETTARYLATENGTAWLLRNDNATIPAPFTNRSLYHTISTMSPSAETRTALFPTKVQILPSNSSTTVLTIRGKPLHNTPALLTSLSQWITARRVQRGTCTLCFNQTPKRNLHPACGGRRGCRETICSSCVEAWYGLNQPGRLINVAALACPFCRRQPTGKGPLPNKVRYLGGLRDAVEEAGGWVYGWCAGRCGEAKRHMERVCARGAPREVEGWWCEGCVDAAAGVDGEGEGGGLVVKECPACGVATEKTAGCDHISCVCGRHWCFNCGEKVAETAGEIYDHMSKVHRTWYADGGGEDFDEVGYEDTEDEMEWEAAVYP